MADAQNTDNQDAADSLAQQRNAALRALRETRQSSETRDAHAAWEAQARRLDG